MSTLNMFIVVAILSSPLYWGVTSKLFFQRNNVCNETKLRIQCRNRFCPVAGFKSNCNYRDYQRDYCKCCKRCTYPPPSTVVCPNRKPKEPVACPLYLTLSCSDEQRIREICEPCKHCATSEPVEIDPCFSSPCPPGQNCVNSPKQCFTTPCDQFECIPRKRNPCETIKCSKGYRCRVHRECRMNKCDKVGRCEVDPDQMINGRKSCPPTKGTISTCNFTNCTETGCERNEICCPKACGGTSCQTPIRTRF